MEKLYDRIDWHNNTSPALNETNLNRMSKAVDDIDDRVVDIAGTVMETVPQIQEDLAEAQELLEDAEEISTHPPIIGQNGNWWVWDTNIDDYADSGVDAGVSLSIGSTTTLPAGSDATVTNTGTATDPVLNFGIPQGEAGQTGAGVPTGGTTGQVLAKASGTDYDTEWITPSGGSGGHTILNGSGTAMTQRGKLQFDGLNVSDDSGNDKTVVKSPIFNGTTAQWETLSSAEKAKYTVVNLTDDYGYSDYSSIDPSNSSVEVYVDTGGRRCYIEKIGNIVFWQVILKVKSSLAANTFHTLYNNLPSAITTKTNSGISGYVAHKTTGEFISPIAVWPGTTGTLGIYSTQNMTTDHAIVLNGFYMTD